MEMTESSTLDLRVVIVVNYLRMLCKWFHVYDEVIARGANMMIIGQLFVLDGVATSRYNSTIVLQKYVQYND